MVHGAFHLVRTILDSLYFWFDRGGAVNIRELRKQTGMNQRDFWWPIGVTQGGGSKYERGRHVPRPVRNLVNLIYVEQVDIEKLTKADQLVAEFLKSEHPETYLAVLAQAKAKLKETANGNDKGAA